MKKIGLLVLSLVFVAASSFAQEKKTQQDHLSYLTRLTESGKLEIGGIIDQNLGNQLGIIILNVDTYEQANEIVLNDPSVKEGMMSGRIRPLNIYFKNK